MNPSLEPTSSTSDASELRLPASFSKRLGAYAIDHVILLGILAPMGVLLCAIEHHGSVSLAEMRRSTPLTIIGWILIPLYFGWFWSTQGATPGKRFLHLRVLDIRTRKNPKFWLGALRATVGYGISSVFFLGFLMALIRDDQLALHDILWRIF